MKPRSLWIARNAIFMCFALMAPTMVSDASDSDNKRDLSRFELISFRTQFLFAAQFGAIIGTTYTGQMSYNPSVLIREWVDFRLNLGWALLYSAQGSTFSSIEYGGLFGLYPYENLLFEVGGGAQSWLPTRASTIPDVVASSTNPLAMANVGFRLRPRFLWVLDRVFVGYSAVFSPIFTHNFRAGLQFNFWY